VRASLAYIRSFLSLTNFARKPAYLALELTERVAALRRRMRASSFAYSSVVSTPQGVDMVTERGVFPGGLQLNINGRNALGEFITNVWVIVFNNECGIFPVISEGDQIGWTKFVSVAPFLMRNRVSKVF
jgi:hypothetical protein